MDEETLDKLREEIMEQLRGLAVNANSDSDYDDPDDGYDDDFYGDGYDEDYYDGEDAADEWYQPFDYKEDGDQVENRVESQDALQDNSEPVDASKDSQSQDANKGAVQEHLKSLKSYEDDQPDEQSDNDEGDQQQTIKSAADQLQDDQPETGVKKKKKRKKKKNHPQADDDEVDSEVLDMQLLEELYDSKTSADHRMRLAIDNFRKERNFVPMSNKILETYFSYGGMDEHPVVVGGAKRTQGAEVTLDIDFVYVVASFLSSHVLNSGIWHDVTYFEMAPRVVLAFLKYIHVRRVMPEYEVEIKKAIDIAQLAKVQTPQCKTFNRMMPDDYSQSCTIHFVREYRSDPLPDKSDELLKQCMGDSSSTKDVQVEGEHMGYARVLRILSENTDEQIGATAAVDPTRVDKIEAATGDTVSLPAADAAEVVVDGPVDPTTANDDKHPTAKTVNPPTVDATGSSTVDTVAPASADEIKPVVVDAADTAVVDTNVLATVDKADTAIVANEALVDAASLSTDDGALAAAPNATKDDSTGLVKLEQPLTSIIVLEPMILEDGVLLPTHGKDYSIRVSSEAAALLGGGTILWGKFYTLSNDTVFARPLMAYPSFHVEEDEEFSSW